MNIRPIKTKADHRAVLKVQVRDGQIILNPVRVQRADAVRAKLAELGMAEQDIGAAVAWAREAKTKVARKPRK